jgi:hypothetical protein
MTTASLRISTLLRELDDAGFDVADLPYRKVWQGAVEGRFAAHQETGRCITALPMCRRLPLPLACDVRSSQPPAPALASPPLPPSSSPPQPIEAMRWGDCWVG